MEAVVGRMQPAAEIDPEYVQRQDGSWLMDGSLLISEAKELLAVKTIPREEEQAFRTLGGFLMTVLERVPVKGDFVESAGWRFEVVDMDGNRVDQVLVSRIQQTA
jgi:putative hemolysin